MNTIQVHHEAGEYKSSPDIVAVPKNLSIFFCFVLLFTFLLLTLFMTTDSDPCISQRDFTFKTLLLLDVLMVLFLVLRVVCVILYFLFWSFFICFFCYLWSFPLKGLLLTWLIRACSTRSLLNTTIHVFFVILFLILH